MTGECILKPELQRLMNFSAEQQAKASPSLLVGHIVAKLRMKINFGLAIYLRAIINTNCKIIRMKSKGKEKETCDLRYARPHES